MMSIYILVGVLLFSQWLLDLRMTDYMVGFSFLQVVTYLPIYSSRMPVQLQYYLVHLRMMITFDWLVPTFLQAYLGDFQTLWQASEEAGFSTDNFFFNLKSYLIICFFYSCLIGLLYFCKKADLDYQDRLKAFLDKQLRGLVFNTLIDSFNLIFVHVTTICFISAQQIGQIKGEVSIALKGSGSYYILLYPLLCFLILAAIHRHFDYPGAQAKVSSLYRDTRYRKSKMSAFVHAFILVHRFVVIAIPNIYHSTPILQAQLLMGSNLVTLLVLGQFRPFYRTRQRMELLNHTAIIIMSTCLPVFMIYTSVDKTQGLFLSVLNVGILLNLGFLAHQQLDLLLSKYRKWSNQRNYEIAFWEWKASEQEKEKLLERVSQYGGGSERLSNEILIAQRLMGMDEDDDVSEPSELSSEMIGQVSERSGSFGSL